ncbi:unnamed protein product [Leuciscus chuanchicus]
MPCHYEYETQGSIQQLSLQWRSPRNQLLCHLIKHKKYSNCTAGYSVHYNPGNITLIIAEEGCTQPQDEDIMDIPLDDPAANKAAAKIQAGFRGHMTRKKMKDDKPREEKQREQK